MRVLSTVLHSVMHWLAAARGQAALTATRTPSGLPLSLTLRAIIEGFTLPVQPHLAYPVVKLEASALTHILLLCAVSWICSMQHSYPGLQLCDGASSSYGAARCNSFAGGCQGAAYGNSSALNCYPNDVWSGTRASSTEYYDFPLDGGVMTRVLRPPVNAYSVRCVPDLDYSKQV